MTIAELRAELNALPADLPVYLSIDEEGNAYHPAVEAFAGHLAPSGDLYEDGVEIPRGAVRVVVLFPA